MQSSARMSPIANMSVLKVNRGKDETSCSGLMYSGDPTLCRDRVISSSKPIFLFIAVSRAHSFKRSPSKRMLLDFRSQWIISLSCRYQTALTVCLNHDLIRRFGRNERS
ncbi:hypothetical protein PMAYCL1PPCAC_00396 [Pristionchus mayeri]|uniref:Uncharacterized protein n=1 Tax=Pristionchus mayeri TaxID=1317129 RepID=A0AAN5C4D5_9BILA|nr:hypothetical protein PMAYCL1PPCAC_00396 [Pristionchus mayeri]